MLAAQIRDKRRECLHSSVSPPSTLPLLRLWSKTPIRIWTSFFQIIALLYNVSCTPLKPVTCSPAVGVRYGRKPRALSRRQITAIIDQCRFRGDDQRTRNKCAWKLPTRCFCDEISNKTCAITFVTLSDCRNQCVYRKQWVSSVGKMCTPLFFGFWLTQETISYS